MHDNISSFSGEKLAIQHSSYLFSRALSLSHSHINMCEHTFRRLCFSLQLRSVPKFDCIIIRQKLANFTCLRALLLYFFSPVVVIVNIINDSIVLTLPTHTQKPPQPKHTSTHMSADNCIDLALIPSHI